MKNLFTKVIGVCCSLIMISLLTATNLNAQYCPAASSNTSDDWISNVTFAGIDNPSVSTTYSDFTAISGTVVPGASYEFSGTIDQTSTWTQTITVYIDWDQSMTWEASERTTIGTSCNTNGCVLTGDIDVPATAIPGETRMRVIHAENTNNTNPCVGPFYGEVEDYTINVQSGVCTPPSFTYTILNDCEAENYDVSALLSDFGTSTFITVYFTRSDEVPVNPVTLIFALEGQTVNLINNVPFGVTVTASIEGSNSICNLTRNWAQLYCHIDGEICDAPLVVSELPFSASGNTSLYLNDYNGTDVAPVAENAITTGFLGNYYIEGDDVVYAYTPDEDGAIDIAATNLATYASLWVFTGCPFDLTVGYHVDYLEGTRTIQHLPVVGGTTYYIVISTWGAITPNTAYTLNITPWEDCTGTPTAGIATEGSMVCAATAFEVVSTDASPDANGLIFTWQSSPASAGAWADVAGANTPTSTVAAGINEATDFRLKAYCTASDETDYSNTISFTVNPNYTECYCIPTYTYDCTSGDDLSNVTLVGESVELNNTTECSVDGYADFTSLPAVDLAPGETYSLSASTTYGSPTYEQVKAWIDYNLNGAFEVEEQILTTAGNGLPGGTDSFDFIVPEGMDAGNYTLRVRLVYGFGDFLFTACDNQSFGETQDYMVEIIDLDACAGTPEAGTAVNDEMGVCALLPFTLSVSGATEPAEGLSRVWQSSPAGTNTWTSLAGATSANYTVDAGINEPTDYRYRLVCENGNQTDVSNVIEVTLNPAVECYCEVSNTVSTEYFISSVSTNNALQDLDRNSGFTAGGYADYSDTDTLIVYANQEFDFSLTFGTYSSQVSIWVDFNQNGSFADAGENVVLNTNYLTSLEGTLLVPELADGSYRMRIQTVSGTPNACGVVNYSETEDYVLKVITLNDCAGTPEAGTVANDFSVCAANEFDLTVSGASSPANGLTRNWQSSPAGANTWSDIPGATSTNYGVEAGINVPTDFRYRVTCTNSSQTDYSNVVSVGLNPGVDCYCTPTYTNDCNSGDDLSNVSLTGESIALDNTTGCSENGYADFTDLPAVDLAPGETYTLSASTTYGSPTYEQVKGWIDYNLNGAFEAEELIFTTAGNGLPGGTDSFDFVVPEGTDAGNYRLRVRLVYGFGDIQFNACDDQFYGETQDYTVEIIELGVCTGTPDGGTAQISESLVCATTPVSLSVTGASDPADGLVRIWQLSIDGGATWSNVAGATSTIYVNPGITVDTDFRYAVTCTNSGQTDYSNVVEAVINTNVTDCYCIPAGTNSGYYINNFSTSNGVENITNNGSGYSAGGYGDFTSMTVSQVQTQSVNFTETFVGGTAGFRIWVDWNQDGSFNPVTEVVWNSTSYSTTHSGSFVVPQTALAGTTRMRVVAHYLESTGLIDPCGSFTWGEFEDYSFNVIALEECAGTPSAGDATIDELTVCANSPITLSVTGASDPATGLSRNWQSSPAGAGVWTAIAGATSPTYILAAGVSVDTDFRYVVTCANSSQSDISNVVEATINTVITECYCIPVGTNSSYYVNSFATTDGIENITNSGSGFSTGGYGDYTSMTVEQAPGESVDFTGTFVGGTAGFRIWVDWNQDGTFDQVSEVVYNTTSYSASWSGSFEVPETALPGTTRMRIQGDYIASAGLVDPCGSTVWGEFEDYTFVVSGSAPTSLSGTVNWNSNCGDRTGTVRIYTPNTSTLIATYNITVNANGAFSIADLPAGTYDVIVKVQGYLAKGIQDVVIANGPNTLAVGTIRNGNVNNDNSINIFDLSLINAAFNKSVGNPSYNPLADLNCDGSVNIFDISILNASFNKAGAVAPL